jgi:alpha-tubulin suppressor-like RCC1 family protein
MTLTSLNQPSLNLYVKPGFESSNVPQLRVKIQSLINHATEEVSIIFSYFNDVNSTTPTSVSDTSLVRVSTTVLDSRNIDSTTKKVQVSAVLQSKSTNVVSSPLSVCTYLVDTKTTVCNGNTINNTPRITRLFGGPRNTMIMSNNGSVWSYGFKDFIHLSSDTFADRDVANVSVPYYTSFNPNEIVSVDIGNSHAGFTTENGQLYTWGDSSNGRLGYTSTNSLNPRLVEIPGDVFIKEIALGELHTLALSSSNNIYYFGKMFSTENAVTSPQLLLTNLSSPVQNIYSGARFSAFITQDNKVYQWGEILTSYNFFGVAQFTKELQPKILPVENVQSLALGRDHGLALTMDGTVFSWGNQLFGALGGGDISSPRENPQLITSLTNIGQISAGDNTSYALSIDGRRLWSWGRNNNGQLGLGGIINSNANIPQEINLANILETDEYIVNIQAGDKFASFLTNKGRLFSWGDFIDYRLGTGVLVSQNRPVEVNLSTLTNKSNYPL